MMGLFLKNITGAFALMDGLLRDETKFIFGYPGGAILPIYDELYSWEKQGLVKHILVRHEQGAIHAADGYSRSTGRVGVCFATSGPGATNLVTGIATAQMDSVPVVIITGQVGRPFIGTDAFQETDIFGITLLIVKHSYVIRDPFQTSQIISEAFYIAQNGRPGPVLIDIPKDVGLEDLKKYIVTNQKDILKTKGYRFEYKTSNNQFKKTLNLILQASQPLIYAGGGIVSSNAFDELSQFAELFQIPVTTTLMGKSSFDELHKLSLGMLGMHGTAYANFSVSECDLLIAIGARFDDRVTGKLDEFASQAQIIHIDIDPAEIGKNCTPHLSIIGDVKEVLYLLLKEQLNFSYINKDQTKAWRERIYKWQQTYPLLVPYHNETLSPQQIIQYVSGICPDAYFTTDVGQHQMWAAQFVKCKSRHWLSSAGLGTMGYGLPAAIGNQIAFPDKKIICITGDSSFQMNIQELGTIAQYNLPIKIIVLNNGWQGMVRQWQQAFYNKRYSHSNMSSGMPDFVNVANAYGLKGFTFENSDNFYWTLKLLLESNDFMLINCKISSNENCYPMVAPGKSNDQMIGVFKRTQKELV
jgi:acetolactate synthase-1/2/3 large subunit